MSNKTALFSAFVAGAAVGALTTYKLVKDKYEKLSQAEAESFAAKLKEMRKNEQPSLSKKTEPANQNTSEPNVSESTEKKAYERVVSELGYTDYASASVRRINSTESIPVKEDAELPQVIDPDEIGEYDDYRIITLLYFTDHVLSDHDGNIVSREEADELLGPDALNRFGEYEEDAVHVRNDARKCYYEVIMEGRLYSDLLRKKPHLLNDEDEDEYEDEED